MRLLAIVPHKFSAPLSIDIHETSLIERHPPTYEVLSYAWGLTANKACIKVGFRIGLRQGKLAVTQNLACALKHLRYIDRPRVL